jgi:radical SAM-linked protein
MFRVWLSLKKDSSVKYISHLDLMQSFEYALRRSKLPIAFSEGFNPRPKMSFGNAVGVGVSSDDERLILELMEPIQPQHVLQDLNGALPPGLRIVSAGSLAEGQKSPLGELNTSDYRIAISASDPTSVQNLLSEIMQSGEYYATRMKSGKPREVNFRPYVIDLAILPIEGNIITIKASFRTTNSGGGRPQDIIQIICSKMPDTDVFEIRRLRQYHLDVTE